MKKVFNSISVLVAMAAITLVSCQKEEIRQESTVETHTVKIFPSTTKTVIGSEEGGTTSIKWTGEETVYAYENNNKATTAALESEDGGLTATIVATFETKAADSYKYHAIVAKSVSNSQNPLLLNEQTATATSYDSDADILVSRVSEPVTEHVDAISLYFARPVVINKMTLTGLSTKGELIKSVEFTASCSLAGRIEPNFETGNIKEYGISDQKKNIIVSYKNNEAASDDKTFQVYFVTFPTLTEDGCGDFTVVVRTNKYVYTKTVTGKKLEFKLDQKTDFKLGLADADKEQVLEDVVYTQVTKDADMFDGAEYIIAAAGSDYAMGAWSGGNNHAQVSITKATSEGGVSTITTNNASGVLPVRISKVEEKDNVVYYALQNASSDQYKDYYLVKTGSGNYLKEDNATLGDSGKWTISISEGKATIKNKGDNSYTIRYNSNSSIFSSYSSGQADVALYINKATCIEKVGDPKLTVTQTGANTITASWTAVENAVGYELYCGDDKVEEYSHEGDNYSYVFNNLTIGTKYTFKVIVKADEGYKDNTVIKELTLADLQLANPTPNVSENSITSSSFVVAWNAVDNAGGYAYYVTQNDEKIPGYESDKTTTETTVTIEGLSANTAYVFHIKTTKVAESAFIEPTEYATASATTLAQDVVWKKVSSITDGEYIIVNNSKYLPSTTTSSSPVQKDITIADNKVASKIADDMKWNIAVGDDGKLTITNSEGKYLYGTADSKGLRVGTTSDTWTLEDNDGAFAIKGSKNKYCATYASGSDWRSYTTKDDSGYGDGGKLYFYKKTADVPATPLSAPANLKCAVQGDDFLTFTWDAVSNAEGYKVSTDGTNYGNPITELSYTLNDLTASTTYTLYVKAIGDGEIYSDSPASSASGTTTAPITWDLDGIAVTTQPAKKEYTTSESFDPAGMVVTATYKEQGGSKEKSEVIPLKDGDKDGYTFTPTGNLTTDVTEITITYQKMTTKVTGITVTASQTVYKLVSASEITEGTYVIGALKSSTATNMFYFATGTVSSGDMNVSTNSVTIEEKNGVRSFITTSLPEGAVEFTFTGNNTDGFTIATGGKYLGYTSASNRKLAFESTYSSFLWTISAKSSPLITNGVVIKHVGTQAYTISENSTGTGAIRGYASTTEYRAIYIFKKVNN